MAAITLLDNNEKTVGAALEEACATATRARIAVAFAKGSGLSAFPALQALSSRGGHVDLLAGIDFQLTDLSVLERFKEPSEARVYAHPETGARRVFHPKLYLVESAERATLIVGSSNLTAGGLTGNVEANIMLQGQPDDPLVHQARTYHDRLWNSGFALRVTEGFRQSYEQLQRRRHEVELSLRAEANFGTAERRLRSALVEAVTTYRSASDRKAWLLITSPENYIRNIQGKIWGDEKKGRIGKVRPGDLIYFYITGLKQLGAMGMVTRETYEDHTPHWPDERIYPFRFGFSLVLQPAMPLPFRPFVQGLDLFGRIDSPNWGQRLQTSMLELTHHDSEVLRVALSNADAADAVA